jgi:hypothetical protein
MAERIPTADGGVIVISKTGEVGYSFNSNRMAWAYAKNDGEIHFGINKGDDLVEEFASNSTEPILPPDCNAKGDGGSRSTRTGILNSLILIALLLIV